MPSDVSEADGIEHRAAGIFSALELHRATFWWNHLVRLCGAALPTGPTVQRSWLHFFGCADADEGEAGLDELAGGGDEG